MRPKLICPILIFIGTTMGITTGSTAESAAVETPVPAPSYGHSTGTRPIPKLGVREAKTICKSQNKKGRDLTACVARTRH